MVERGTGIVHLGDALAAVIIRLAFRAMAYHRRRATDNRLTPAQRAEARRNLEGIAAAAGIDSIKGGRNDA